MLDASLDSMPDTQRRKAVELYQRGDMSAEDIATEIGISRATLYNWLAQEGVSGTRRHPAQSLATADLATIAENIAGVREALSSSPVNATLEEMMAAVRENGAELATARLERAELVAAIGELRRDLGDNRTHYNAAIADLRSDIANLRESIGRLQGIAEVVVSILRPPTADPTGPRLVSDHTEG